MTAADRYPAHVSQGSTHVQRQEPELGQPRLPTAEYFDCVLQEFASHLQLHRFGVVSQAR
ncbi:hypothetical protein [Streptomyces sp. NRRL S-1813]|uniref:hypothetical protein n=1 Tax=Streptomyces sp. NRRL S-1813 TaxID=1463888 RepID=UPI000AD1F042|nr:hypothetical protein [Streptomyces sp. NRRL S-1813]